MDFPEISYQYNIPEVLEQELTHARDYYHWACTLPYYSQEASERYKDARDRLEKVNRMMQLVRQQA